MTEQAPKTRAPRAATAKEPTPEEIEAAEQTAMAEATAQAIANHGTLLTAIAWVTSRVGEVQKNGHNAHFNYSYATKDDVIVHMKPILSEAGLLVLPRFVKTERSEPDDKGMIDLVVTWEMQIIHAPTGASLSFPWESESMDNQDKGFAKAVTSAMKQFVVAFFGIPSGDNLDVEHDASSAQDRSAGQRQSSGAPRGGATATVTTKTILDFKETHGLSNVQLGQAIEAAGGDPRMKVKDLPADLRPTILANLERIVSGGETAAQDAMAEQPDYGPGPGSASPSDDDIPF